MTSMWPLRFILLSSFYSLSVHVAEEERSCNSLHTQTQREMCHNNTDLLSILEDAELEARIACETVCAHEIWNCSDFTIIRPSVAMRYPTKEAAFIYSIMSASVARATAAFCASNANHNLPCGCFKSSKYFTISNRHNAIISGCPYDLDFGLQLSEQFMDSFHIFSSDMEQFSFHNNRVGRLFVQNSTVLSCSCIGVSISCTFRTCNLQLENLSTITHRMLGLYDTSYKINSTNAFVNGSIYEEDRGPILDETKLVYFYDRCPNCIWLALFSCKYCGKCSKPLWRRSTNLYFATYFVAVRIFALITPVGPDAPPSD